MHRPGFDGSTSIPHVSAFKIFLPRAVDGRLAWFDSLRSQKKRKSPFVDMSRVRTPRGTLLDSRGRQYTQNNTASRESGHHISYLVSSRSLCFLAVISGTWIVLDCRRSIKTANQIGKGIFVQVPFCLFLGQVCWISLPATFWPFLLACLVHSYTFVFFLSLLQEKAFIFRFRKREYWTKQLQEHQSSKIDSFRPRRKFRSWTWDWSSISL